MSQQQQSLSNGRPNRTSTPLPQTHRQHTDSVIRAGVGGCMGLYRYHLWCPAFGTTLWKRLLFSQTQAEA